MSAHLEESHGTPVKKHWFNVMNVKKLNAVSSVDRLKHKRK